MNKCPNCGEVSASRLVIFTETTFGHGDSTHDTYVKCTSCGCKGKKSGGWGFFETQHLREAQDNWNNGVLDKESSHDKPII